jgi:hypothetical protein
MARRKTTKLEFPMEVAQNLKKKLHWHFTSPNMTAIEEKKTVRIEGVEYSVWSDSYYTRRIETLEFFKTAIDQGFITL